MTPIRVSNESTKEKVFRNNQNLIKLDVSERLAKIKESKK